MLTWTDEEQELRKAVRRFVEAEVAPRREELEHGDLAPYGIMRRYSEAFGVGDIAIERFESSLRGEPGPAVTAAQTLIPMIEFSRYCPGIVTSMGVSTSLTAGAIIKGGSAEQKERWVPDLLTIAKVGSWAITEPDSGSDAFGSMRATARPDGDGYVLNGAKTFITNGPDADTIVFICRLADGTEERRYATFVLDRGLPGLVQSAPLRKMGLHSSRTGELSLTDVVVGPDRLLAPAKKKSGPATSDRSSAMATFVKERASIAAMALGIIERCLELSVDYARTRVQFGRSIGDFQLIQLKLAQMEVARLNVENLLLRYLRQVDAGVRPSLTEASATKLYAAQAAMQVSLEAVQVFGGNGYMAENHVEQLCRDAKVLQIYAGTDEIQVSQIAKDLLRGRR
ncbi:acyl-CoA dehydrogenase family protein [Pseudofrankia asymbiotica]|uniref:Acyl-CoA dehydrogenase n=1 Tax=Pseudofrankia asymbiotica TaxID=1834516 RepID=A0A1V2IF85_9ACTN|nr:acyl-CoA dehydrogenase family protein [Pseudofrankia asymbiotica]ONH31777.1 acyl-CoA dehydrogenase [Pseudofrankia asymbiotica]